MNAQTLSRAILAAVLLLLTAGPGLAQGPQSAESAMALDAVAAANAPWFMAEIDTDGDIGQHASVAIDQLTGATYVSYYDATNKDLRMARYVGSGGNCGPRSSWYCQTVDSGGDVGQYSSIAAGQGHVRIAYHDATNGSLKQALATDPSDGYWTIQTVDDGYFPISAGLFTSIKLTASGYPYISYYSDNPSGSDELKLARFAGSGGNCGHGIAAGMWWCQTIRSGDGVGQYTSLALDDFHNQHIAYYDRGSSQLSYATSRFANNCGPAGNSWTCYPVSGSTADVGQYVSLYVDNDRHFHIAYYDATTDMLKYAVDVGGGGNCGILGSAQCDTIDAMPADYHPVGISIAEDAAGYPIIAYQSEYGSLNVARPLAALGLPVGAGNCGPESLFLTWHCETIHRYGRFNPYRNGDFASIALNSAGLATIAYNGFITSSGGNLYVAYQRLQIFLPLVMK